MIIFSYLASSALGLQTQRPEEWLKSRPGTKSQPKTSAYHWLQETIKTNFLLLDILRLDFLEYVNINVKHN